MSDLTPRVPVDAFVVQQDPKCALLKGWIITLMCFYILNNKVVCFYNNMSLVNALACIAFPTDSALRRSPPPHSYLVYVGVETAGTHLCYTHTQNRPGTSPCLSGVLYIHIYMHVCVHSGRFFIYMYVYTHIYNCIICSQTRP